MYYFLKYHPDMAGACAHARRGARAQSARVRKAKSLMQSQLGYYIYGNRRAVLLYRLFAIRIVSENGA